MSVSTKPLDRDENGLPVEAPVLAVSEDSRHESPHWPVTRLPAWSMTMVLALSLLAPTAIGRNHGPRWLALLLPAVIATLAARALFETLSLGLGPRGLARHLAAAIPASVIAVALMALSCVVVGVGFSALTGIATAVPTALTLLAAGQLRDLEIRFRLSFRRVYFIGSNDGRRDLERELSRRHDARLVGSASVDPSLNPRALVDAVLAARATMVVLDNDAMRAPALVDVASRLNLAGLRVRDLVSYYESEFKKVPLTELSPTWFLFDIASIHRRRAYRLLRRSFEAAFAALLLLVSLPLLLLAAVAVKLSSRGPVLYRQRRVGREGAQFTLLKLRTMTQTDDTAAAWAPSQAHRVTGVGRFLRRFRLDELPQLWNVIRGDLALVGPRPEQVPIAERLDTELPFYGARHCIRPGITGWAQVNFGYGGSVEGTMAKLQRDLYYVKHGSLRLDALILWLTLKTVIAGRG